MISLHDLHQQADPIVMLTAYDYPSARLADEAGVDMILVGASVGMVVHGLETTLPVTMEMMILHCQAVMRGVARAFVVGDMPFMSYQTSPRDALRNAGRMLAEGGVHAVKLEGGAPVVETVRTLVRAGIAVQGHIGLTPQSIRALGGWKAQGKTIERARQLIHDAKALEEAGAFSIVLEAVPAKLAGLITAQVGVPTIGIGAGGGTDGQGLVMHDGLNLSFTVQPRFSKQYIDAAEAIRAAYGQYIEEVRAGTFPQDDAHGFSIPDDVWEVLREEFG
ncbi:MAG: 3-methyl-2-oxobutanoate hydroxymethyltransferase [Anaerolineae bacterium]